MSMQAKAVLQYPSIKITLQLILVKMFQATQKILDIKNLGIFKGIKIYLNTASTIFLIPMQTILVKSSQQEAYPELLTVHTVLL